MLRIAGGLAALALCAATASAQPTAAAKDDETGLFCVYDTLSAEDAATVAKVFLYDDTPEEQIGQAALIVRSAAEACRDRFGLSPSKAASMSDMGIYGTVIDYLSGALRAAGATQQAVDGMFYVYGGLGEEEIDKLFDADWRSDIAFAGKLKQALVDNGMPDRDETIDTSFTVFEVSAMADEAIYLFLVADLGANG